MLSKKDRKDESGFAAIVVGITLVIVTSLLVVGFAELMRNEQRQVTNRQLSSQAFYAAESGINDAAKAINSGFKKKKDTCGPLTSADADPITAPLTSVQYLTDNTVDTTNDPVNSPRYTCLLIDPSPPTVEYDPVSKETPKVFLFKGVDATNGTLPVDITDITFHWQDVEPSRNATQTGDGRANDAFPRSSDPAWGNNIGALKISITPVALGDLSNVTRNLLQRNEFTAYLYPTTNASNNEISVPNPGAGLVDSANRAQSGVILNGACSPTKLPRKCSATLDFYSHPFVQPETQFLVAIQSIYSETNVAVSVTGSVVPNPSPPPARTAGAQALVDSTGKAQNVLKRLQVRIPYRNQYSIPGFSAEATGNICKQFTVYPGFAEGNGCNLY